MIYKYLDAHGDALLRAVGYKTMKLWYGQPFVLWYNMRHLLRKSAFEQEVSTNVR